MSFGVRVEPGAMADIEKLTLVAHASSARSGAFHQELDALLALLESQPHIGTVRRLRAHGDVHVLSLRRSRYLVIYEVKLEPPEVWIVRVRQGNRRPLTSR